MTLMDRALVGGYRRLARPLLFRVGGGDAEAAHHRTIAVAGAAARREWLMRSVGRLLAADSMPRTVFGLKFPNVVGLAAGVDKDGVALAAWPALGFGFVEVGTVTALPQPGNPPPRLFRLPTSGALINRMGFNNSGAAALAERVVAAGQRGSIGVPLGISLGKSKITPVAEAVGDYLTSFRAVQDVADYIAVNVSSPNTPNLRSLQDRGPLDELLGALTEQADLAGRSGRPALPVLVKIAPDLSENAIGEVLAVCADRGVSGIIASNTTLSRVGVAAADIAVAAQQGGLSGEPLRRRALEMVRFVASHTELPVVGVGGIGSPDDAMAMLDAGASLIQLYSGFIYSGPGLVRGITHASAKRSEHR